VLFEGDEIGHLSLLAGLLDHLIDDLGDVPDQFYLQDRRWEDVTHRAAIALAAMVRAGGF
jgi:hypothetical protein